MISLLIVLFIMLFTLVALFIIFINVPAFLYSHDYEIIYRETKHTLFMGDSKTWKLKDVFEKCKIIESKIEHLSITKEINISELVLVTAVYVINNSHLRTAPVGANLRFIKLKYITLYISLYLRNIHGKF